MRDSGDKIHLVLRQLVSLLGEPQQRGHRGQDQEQNPGGHSQVAPARLGDNRFQGSGAVTRGVPGRAPRRAASLPARRLLCEGRGPVRLDRPQRDAAKEAIVAAGLLPLRVASRVGRFHALPFDPAGIRQ